MTTTGISASMPMMLTLIEAIAGRARAEVVARDLGLAEWGLRHASGAFKLTRPFATTVLGNRMAFWHRETLGIRLEPGMDEVLLALVADAWSRTCRSSAVAYVSSPSAITTVNGVLVPPDHGASDRRHEFRASTVPDLGPVAALDHALMVISARYCRRTAAVVAINSNTPRQAGRRRS